MELGIRLSFVKTSESLITTGTYVGKNLFKYLHLLSDGESVRLLP
jgi:hypothetical protein